MTSIVYFIGNGFDINLGARTAAEAICNTFIEKYQKNDFAAFLMECKDNCEQENEFFHEKNWTDYEVMIGKYLWQTEWEVEVNDKRKSVAEFFDFVRSYLEQIERELLPSLVENNLDASLIDMLVKPKLSDFFRNEQKLLDSNGILKNGIERIFAVFNYTRFFEHFYKIYLKQASGGSWDILYPHGCFGEKIEFQIVIGAPAGSINDPNRWDRYFLKDEQRRMHTADVERYLMSKIQIADVFVIYGMSLGISDHEWWNAIIERLINLPTSILVIGIHNLSSCVGSNPYDIGLFKDELIKELFEAVNIQDKNVDIFDQIIVVDSSKLIPKIDYIQEWNVRE